MKLLTKMPDALRVSALRQLLIWRKELQQRAVSWLTWAAKDKLVSKSTPRLWRLAEGWMVVAEGNSGVSGGGW